MLYQLAAKALSPILFGNQKSSGRNMRTATRHIRAVAVHAELSNVVARASLTACAVARKG